VADGAGVRTNPRIRRSLITYLGAAALVLVVVAVGAVLVGRQVAQDEALRDAERVAQRTANLVVAPLLAEVLAGDASRRPELDRAVANRIRDGSIAELNVWDRTGTVIYSDDIAEIGERIPIPDEAAAAIDSGAVTSNVTDAPETGPIPGSDRLVEVYAPLRLPGQAPLAFEIYLSYDRVESTANNLVLRIVPLAVGALLLLQLIQTPITVSLARRVAGHEAERAALLERALSASERERRQIAADLHDGVVQDLAATSMALAGAAVEADRAGSRAESGRLHVAADAVRGAIRSLRSLVVDIHPPNLRRTGLAAALGDLAETTTARGVAATLVVDDGATRRLGCQAEQFAFRVAQEALRNVVVHADATAVELRVGRRAGVDGDVLTLAVTDDGNGFDPAAPPADDRPHMGLQLLNDLADDVGGRIEVTSVHGAGTTVTMEVPVS